MKLCVKRARTILWGTLRLPCALVLAMVVADRAHGHPSILRWTFEATIIAVEGSTAARFPDMRIGDDIRGAICYDKTTPGVDLPLDPAAPEQRRTTYDLAPIFPLVDVMFENPRTAETLLFGHEENGGMLVADNLVLSTVVDWFTVSQYMYSPTNPMRADVRADIIFSGHILDGTALPAHLALEEWDAALLFLQQIGEGQLMTEIHTLTAVNVPFIPGDFTGDGLVGGRDLDAWQFANGSVNANLAADANGDSRVDGSDFLIWQRQLGAVSAGNGATEPAPEPASGLLTFVGTTIAIIARRRRQSGRTSCS
jgi:hypothetical protein